MNEWLKQARISTLLFAVRCALELPRSEAVTVLFNVGVQPQVIADILSVTPDRVLNILEELTEPEVTNGKEVEH